MSSATGHMVGARRQSQEIASPLHFHAPRPALPPRPGLPDCHRASKQSTCRFDSISLNPLINGEAPAGSTRGRWVVLPELQVSIPSSTGRPLQDGALQLHQHSDPESQSPHQRGGPCRLVNPVRLLEAADEIVSIPSSTGRPLQARGDRRPLPRLRWGVSIPSSTGRPLQVRCSGVRSSRAICLNPLINGEAPAGPDMLSCSDHVLESQSPHQRGGPCRPRLPPGPHVRRAESQSPHQRGGPCRMLTVLVQCLAKASQSPHQRGGPCRCDNGGKAMKFNDEVSIPSSTGRPLQGRWVCITVPAPYVSLNPLINGEAPAGRAGARAHRPPARSLNPLINGEAPAG